jgi:hypothetical protein
MYKEEILEKIKHLQHSYLPDWKPDKKDSAWAVAELFSDMMSELKEEFDRVPQKLFITYLDRLGYSQKSPQPAKVPISFLLGENYKGGVVVPKYTEVATKSKISFETTEAMMATSAKLISLIDIDNKYITDNSQKLISGEDIAIFANQKSQNFIYFGDDNLFDIHKRDGSSAGLKFTVPKGINGHWEYFGKTDTNQEDWFSFKYLKDDKLNKSAPYKTVKRVVNGIKSYWIRAKIEDKLSNSFGMNFQSRSNIDSLFHNNGAISLSGTIYPFGHIPQVNDSFYISSREAFSKKGFEIEIDFIKSYNIDNKNNLFSWEYWNGKTWKHLIGGKLFKTPMDMTPTIVNGEENYWVRVRLLDNTPYVTYSCSSSKLEPKFTPPTIDKIEINVHKRAISIEPKYIYQYKNKEYIKPPFIATPIDDTSPTIYFGFDRPFEAGLISLYIKIKNESHNQNKPLKWQYYEDSGWSTLNIKDGSSAFSKSGFIQFIAPNKQKKIDKFGLSQYWIRVIFDTSPHNRVIEAIYMNTIEARESKTINKMLLGSSDGSGSQKFTIEDKPLFELKLWVLESTLPEGFDGYRDRFGDGYWVLWSPVQSFENLGANQRAYMLDGSLGEIYFGDNRGGNIPPLGEDNIRVSYRIGGGVRGNLPAREINTLVDTVAYIDGVVNHIESSGGVNLQSIENLMRIAPKRIKHRYRAVNEEDYYYLVLEASSSVAKISVVPSRGQVKLYIVPFSSNKKPLPSLGLINLIEKYIGDIAPATVNILIEKPKYIGISLNVTITIIDWQFATTIKGVINKKLESFLHPLYGGDRGDGWEFGTLPMLVDLYSLFSTIEGVDTVDSLSVELSTGESYSINEPKMPQFGRENLVCSGTHTIEISKGG